MQRVVVGIVFLSQTSAVDSLSTTTWPGLILAMLGGSAGVAIIHKIVAEHLREKREDARRQADEDKLRRDAIAAADIEQQKALTMMARSVPEQFERMGKRFDALASTWEESNRLLSKQLDANTQALGEVRREMASDTRAIVLAIAGKLGVQTNADDASPGGSRRLSNPGAPHA